MAETGRWDGRGDEEDKYGTVDVDEDEDGLSEPLGPAVLVTESDNDASALLCVDGSDDAFPLVHFIAKRARCRNSKKAKRTRTRLSNPPQPQIQNQKTKRTQKGKKD